MVGKEGIVGVRCIFGEIRRGVGFDKDTCFVGFFNKRGGKR